MTKIGFVRWVKHSLPNVNGKPQEENLFLSAGDTIRCYYGDSESDYVEITLDGSERLNIRTMGTRAGILVKPVANNVVSIEVEGQ